MKEILENNQNYQDVCYHLMRAYVTYIHAYVRIHIPRTNKKKTKITTNLNLFRKKRNKKKEKKKR